MQEKHEAIVDKMFGNDHFSKWLGIERKVVGKGYCVLSMKLRKEMLNGFGLAHGGIAYALADSALAFASNSHGLKCLSVDTQISHLVSLREDETITATAREVIRGSSMGRYDVEIRNGNGELAAHFSGSVYTKQEEWKV